MSYATILPLVKGILEDVDGVVNVHDYFRHVKDLTTRDTRFLDSDNNRIHTWMITRDEAPSAGALDGYITRIHQIKLVGYYEINDYIASEKNFQQLADTVADAFNNNRSMASSANVPNAAQLLTMTQEMFCGVLCHNAIIGLTIEEDIYSGSEIYITPDVSVSPEFSFVVMSGSDDLTNERILTEGTNIDIIDNGAGQSVIINTVASPQFDGLIVSPVTLGNVLSANGTTFVSMTPDAAALVDKTSIQTISGAKTFSNHVVVSTGKELRLYDADNSNYVGFVASTLSSNQIWKFPSVDGTSGQALVTDGAGNLSFASAGVSTFINLNDTDPTTYIGQAGKAVIVNTGELGLEFGQDVRISATPTFAGIIVSSVTSGNVLSSDGTAFVGGTPETAGLVDKTSVQTIGGVKTFSNHVVISTGKELRLQDVDNSNYIGFVAPALAANRIWTLPSADGTSGQVLVTSGAGVLSFATAGVSNFLALTDTPGSYSGQAGKVVAVNGGANALEFITTPAASLAIGGTITGGTANKILYESATNVLAESGNLQFDGTFLTIAGQLIVPKIRPSSDSITAIQIMKADGITGMVTVDTINSRFGIGTASPNEQIEIGNTTGASCLFIRQDSNVFSGDELGHISFDTNAFTGSETVWGGVVIRAVATNTYDYSNRGARLEFLTKTNTTAHNQAAGLVLTLNQDKSAVFEGNVTINSTKTLIISTFDFKKSGGVDLKLLRDDGAISSGDELSRISFDTNAFTGSETVLGSGLIRAIATTNYDYSNRGARLEFLTKTNTTAHNQAAGLALVIDQSQYIGIGISTPLQKLHLHEGNFLVGKQSSTSAREIFAQIPAWIDSTDATRKGKIAFNIYDTTAREFLAGEASGSAAKIGFLGASPIIRQSHIADADGTLADITSKFNTLLSYLESYGLVTTS